MKVKIPDGANLSMILRWLEDNVGNYGKDWRIVYNDPRPNVHLHSKYNDLDITRPEDALAYNLKFGIHT